MKITPKHYVEARDAIGRAGFMAIRELLHNDKTIIEVATTYGIEEQVVELVKTTSSYDEYLTIVKLEVERGTLQQKLHDVEIKEARVKPKRWHYIIAGLIILGLVWLGIWGIVSLVGFIGGLLK